MATVGLKWLLILTLTAAEPWVDTTCIRHSGTLLACVK